VLRSFHVFRIPMTGLPANSSVPSPNCLSRDRCPNDRRSSGPNQRWERRSDGARQRAVGTARSVETAVRQCEGKFTMKSPRQRQSRAWPRHILPCVAELAFPGEE
jgi:hypothetical protein